ncbi:hypothetical protein Alches_18690 [Alicyclobacillus hesperidum subsp. aegles]|uniref:hypothetical protein n=1 Tax=Alicyclobacillus hesperidum TaxID=89784 RepID=UPI00222CC448|nr:hypothetical protein [Alicyclobacillus hesperidum]GLG01828.1 hypothetical protein Alches_18690 [Alicyclobacillus hesperidum subsp. aegles]
MIKAMAKVTVKKDLTAEIKKSLQALAHSDVYVGIPEGDIGDHPNITNAQLLYIQTHGVRTKEMREEMNDYMGITADGMPIMRDFNRFLDNLDSMPYSQAYDLFIHEHGSALWKIPPRPVLEPAIDHSKDVIADQLRQATLAALNGGDVQSQLRKAGEIGMQAARDWFVNPLNEWPANAPSTVKQKGSDRPLIDTGNLRQSITYVVVTDE